MTPHQAHPRLPLSPVKSSHLQSVGYDPATHTLDVAFRSGGPTYRYHGVPPTVHESLMAAPSKGKFFGTAIRGRFRHSTLPTTTK